MNIHIRALLALSLLIGSTSMAQADTTWAKGIVYNDLNASQTRDTNEPGLPDVRVSNGRIITKTAADGSYQLPVRDGDLVFVIKPSEWASPVDDQNRRVFFLHP